MARDAILQIRRQVESDWVESNFVLKSGEFGYETDTNRLKVGDGVTPWTSLDYVTGGSYTISGTPPGDPQEGDIWFNSTTGRSYIYYDAFWVEVGSSGGEPGQPGPPGIVISGTPPTNTSILWYDTSSEGSAILPVGGATGQVLKKLSNADYHVGWATP